MPLIARMSGVMPAGLRLGGQVRLLDVAPTIQEMAGVREAPETAPMQGRGMASAFSGGLQGSTAEQVHLTECTWMRKRGMRTLDWKLIVAREHPDPHGRPPVELYDPRRDPAE